jgi:hypothetical protein
LAHTLRFSGNTASFDIQAALLYGHQVRGGFSKLGSPQVRRGTEVKIEDLVKPQSRAFEESIHHPGS